MSLEKFSLKNRENDRQTAEDILARLGFSAAADEDRLMDIQKEIYKTDKSESIPDEELTDFLCACLFIGSDELNERALMNLYYAAERSIEMNKEMFDLFGEVEADDDELTFLVRFCSDPSSEPGERLRGRKYWTAVNLMLSAAGTDDKIEELIRTAKACERSPWVWDRIFAAAGGWDDPLRIYPEMESWKEITALNCEHYADFLNYARKTYKRGIKAGKSVRQRIGSWIDLLTGGKIGDTDLDWIFAAAGEAGTAFPLELQQFRELLNDADPIKSNHLLHLFGLYLNGKTFKQARDYLRAIEEQAPKPANTYEVSARIQLKLADLLISGRSPGEDPYRASLDFFIPPFPDGLNKPSAYQTLTESFTPILLRIINEKKLKELYMDKLCALLDHRSEYVKLLGANLLLTAKRAGYRIAPALEKMKEVLKACPETKNAFAGGKDIPDEDYSFRIDFGSLKPFLVADEAKEEGGFFNLDGLTGLLEACQPPNTAWRLAKTLRLEAEESGDTELIRFLSGFREENEVLSDMEIPAEAESGAWDGYNEPPQGIKGFMGFAMTTSLNEGNRSGKAVPEPLVPEEPERPELPPVPPLQPGPLRLSELLTLFNESLSGSKNLEESRKKAFMLAEAKAAELGRIGKGEDPSRKHQMIREIFEGPDPREIRSDEVAGLFRTILNRLKSENAGREEIARRGQGAERTADHLAYYLKRCALESRRKHRWGIYFNVFRVLELIHTKALQPEALIRSVAIHELFHAFMEVVLGDRSCSHYHRESNRDFCRLEEAAADRMAYEWLVGRDLPKSVLNSIIEAVYPVYDPEKGTGLPGYGEYHVIDGDAPLYVPKMVLNNLTGDHDPAEYRHFRLLNELSTEFTAEKMQYGAIWKGMLYEIENETVPFYFDLTADPGQ